ncbi:MAG: PIN domain-containing protein [Chloroflexota bacterium]
MINGSAVPSCVLDASALLATVHQEPGAEVVKQHLEDAVISAVNWAEVVQKALAWGVDVQRMRAYIDSLRVLIVPFDADAADAAAGLWIETRRAGLSLADRCCLALARRLRIPALTADRAWAQLAINVDIRVIR